MLVPSSRRSGAKWLCLGTLGAVLLVTLRPVDAPQPNRPVVPAGRSLELGVLRDPGTTPCVEHAAQAQEQLRLALWLSLSSLPPQRLQALLELAEELLDGVAARSHPLGLDLSERSPEDLLRTEAAWFLPKWTAARSLAKRCFISGDRSLSVAVPDAAGSLPEGATPFDVWAVDSDVDRLPRLLAWPLSAARPARVALAASGDEALRGLRVQAGAVRSPVALVIERRTLDVDAQALLGTAVLRQLRALRDRTRAVGKGLRPPQLKRLIAALEAGLPEAPVLPFLHLADREVLLIPELVAVGDPGALARAASQVPGVQLISPPSPL